MTAFTVTAFTITVTGPGYSATRRYPSVWCADAALRWATMLRTEDGYTADVTQAEAAANEARRLRMAEEQRKAKGQR